MCMHIGGRRYVSSCQETMSFSAECTGSQEHKASKSADISQHIHVHIYLYIHKILLHMNAPGRHPCLWCNITSDMMRIPREERPQIEPRTLSTLQADLLLFQTTGKGNLKQAKNHNNVISEPFFPIPLSQVNMCNVDQSNTNLLHKLVTHLHV